MATVTDPLIPPSLADRLGHILKATGPNQIGINPRARYPAPDPGPALPVAILIRAANWLADQWQGPAQSYDRSRFYAQRLDELRAGQFPAAYWQAATPILDRTNKSTPISSEPWNGPINPAYTDPNRLPTDCRYRHTGDAYLTPAGDGTETFPAPGWRGEVNAGYFRDIWHAQQTFAFTLPTPLDQESRRPILVHTTTAIEATATTRGNWTWFTVEIAGRWLQVGELPAIWGDRTLAYWTSALQSPIALPDANPNGWSYATTLQRIQDAWRDNAAKSYLAYSGLQLNLATPPSKGRYYARNDAVRVTHHSTCAVYQAKDPP